MKKKMLLVTLAVLLLTLLIVGVASANGWFIYDWGDGTCDQYHWASDHKIMVTWGGCSDGVMVSEFWDILLLDGAKFDPLKTEQRCEGALFFGYDPDAIGLTDLYGRPDVTWDGAIYCWFPAGYWD